MKTSKLTVECLKNISTPRPDNAISISELMELLCQIALALLIIFVMANVLFTAKARSELDEAKGMIGFWKARYKDIADTPAGEQYKLRYKALINLQKQKLLNAVDKIEASARREYDLTRLTKTQENGKLEFITEGILSADKIVDTRFVEACKLAKETVPYHDKICQEWLSRVSLMEGMRLTKPFDHSAGHENLETLINEVITKENEAWLFREINRRVEDICNDIHSLQRAVLAQLQSFLREKPQTLKGTKVYELVREYPSAPPKEQGRLIEQISKELYQYAKTVFATNGVPLLNEV